MPIQLSDHFDYKRLLRFTYPSICMMLFTSIYSIVDGYFVSNYAGKMAFTAVNFTMPILYILASIGFMVGSGGCALMGKLLGEQKRTLANQVFSMLIHGSLLLGILLALGGYCLMPYFVMRLGAQGEMLRLAVQYGRICMFGLPFLMLQMEFQSFCILAEKPKLGMWTTVFAGVANGILDAWLVGFLSWGVFGAALATVVSMVIGALIPLLYFCGKCNHLLRLGRPRFMPRELWQVCLNGSSEMMSNLAMSFIGMVYNFLLLKYAGEDGVAAYGVLMYLGFIFVACFLGYAVGISPIVSYHFGAQNHYELRSLLRKSLVLFSFLSILMLACGECLALPLAKLYAGYDENLLEMTQRAFRIFSFSFLFMGFPILGSAFFTALNNGLVSAVISFMRTLVLQLLTVLVLAHFWGSTGIWCSLVVADCMATIMTFSFLFAFRNKYHFW